MDIWQEKPNESPSKISDNNKVSITCSNVPEELFDATAAKKHFSKFGRVHKIRLLPKRQMCIIQYENHSSVEKALLNAGAYDGFLFEVTRTKLRTRRKSKKDDDPDWLPDSDVEEELTAMSGSAIYRVPRQKPQNIKQTIPRKKVQDPPRPKAQVQPTSGIESPVIVATQTTLSTSEAATELHQLRSKVSLTPDEKWRILDSRDRILRSWGGAGSRVKVGGATIGTCPDMCPEKELLHRQAEHQVMTLETVVDSDGVLETWRAVKQYSRSSADQEMPMCYELRPPHVLMKTYSIHLVEMCARFHAHCAARLADLEHTQFDQKLNTDNLTKCLQTLKHMYSDATADLKPNEAEFRGYIALLNLGDANFWWEIKQLPLDIQKSAPIIFAIKIFAALDNNNYVRFFRLVRDEATYLQACILLRYFNDVRARALVRIVKAYAPRGGSKYPAEDLINSLAFESFESMHAFICHYGLRCSKSDQDVSVILDRNQFIEDSDPYPMARSIELIESKRKSNVAGVISGGNLPNYDYKNHICYSSFNSDGRLKDMALIAEDLGYNTLNDSNKDIRALKNELHKLNNGVKSFVINEIIQHQKTNTPEPVLLKESKPDIPKETSLFTPSSKKNRSKPFFFQPATPLDVPEVIKISPEKICSDNIKNVFKFSKPNATPDVKSVPPKNIFGSITSNSKISSSSLFKLEKSDHEQSQNLFTSKDETNVFSKTQTGGSIFAPTLPPSNDSSVPIKSLFASANTTNIFLNNDVKKGSIFASSQKPLVTTNDESGPNKLSPGTLFKQANEPFTSSNQKYSIFSSKNKILETTKTILQENNVYEFDHNEQPINSEILSLNEEKKKREEIERIKKDAELREIERKNEEVRRQEEARRKQEEMKRLEEIRKKEQEKKELELKRELEEKRQAEMKRIAEVNAELFKQKVEKESEDLIEELLDELNKECVEMCIKEEMDKLNNLIRFAKGYTDEVINELVEDISSAELNAEIFWTKTLMKKWFNMWKKHTTRNFKRRRLLDDTPIWLSDKTPKEKARFLKRLSEDSALKQMNAFHRGYKFKGELNELPPPEKYNIMELIKSPLLKRMKQINYPYDKCFFWKLTLVSPGSNTWAYKKINIERWLLNAFGGEFSMTVNGLIHLKKQSWNNLMDFATSVTLIIEDKCQNHEEVLQGSNGLIFYMCHEINYNIDIIENVLKKMVVYHVVPIAIITTKINNTIFENDLKSLLSKHMEDKVISDFKIYVLNPENAAESLSLSTKSAMKWLAKRCPKPPSIEIDSVKGLCERYLGNELWPRLRSEHDLRVKDVMTDLRKLVDLYNVSVDKLTDVLTDENLINYPSFPLEFKKYLNNSSPYPKPYEFIHSNVKNGGNLESIRFIMQHLKLDIPKLKNHLKNACVQNQVQQYCEEIGWLTDSDVVCKVVALIPKDLNNISLACDGFVKNLNQLHPVDILNVIVYEKFTRIKDFETYFAIYDKNALDGFRNLDWLYNVKVIADMKHKVNEFKDEIDYYIEAKRRRVDELLEYPALQEKDCTKLQSIIEAVDKRLVKGSMCTKALTELEKTIDEGKKRSEEIDNLLRMFYND
ncbi:unnamed protein product [Leptidea sinapis]|uniref:RRM domain-containing protein n=1 Tax=Leptidea sinapis TaxID=189913 RepID=A0A5E4PMT7_9NEOP|nr:unnamed protein product [Leptidea sinapis]